jgi:hypothetical protein
MLEPAMSTLDPTIVTPDDSDLDAATCRLLREVARTVDEHGLRYDANARHWLEVVPEYVALTALFRRHVAAGKRAPDVAAELVLRAMITQHLCGLTWR